MDSRIKIFLCVVTLCSLVQAQWITWIRVTNRQVSIMVHLLLMLVIVSLQESSYPLNCERNCTCTPPSITCKSIIPKQLPTNITKVTITRFMSLTDNDLISKMNFSHPSFAGVRTLLINPDVDAYITENQYLFNGLPHDAFVGLSSLEHLQYASLNLNKLLPYTFRGVDTLTSLDLSHNLNLPGSMVAKALSIKTILPNLEELKLSNIQNSLNLEDFDSKGATMKNRPIKSLDFSRLHMDVGITKEGILSAFPHLKTLNISGCEFGVTSGHYFAFASGHLTSLDISSTNLFGIIQTFMKVFKFPENHKYVVIPYKFNYRELYIDNANSNSVPVFLGLSSSYLIGKTCFRICFEKMEDLKDQRLCFNDTHVSQLEIFSCSRNMLRYVTSDVMQFFSHLRYLNLGGNKLEFMQRRYPHEFEILFLNNGNLTELILSNNDLTDLPSAIFKGNGRLQHIDLSNNGLASMTFDLSKLTMLRHLNLRFNKFKVMDQESINKLVAFETFMAYQNISSVLSLKDNFEDCQCDLKDTMEWILKTTLIKDRSEIACHYEGRSHLFSEQLLTDVEYICIKYVIISMIITASVISCIVLVSLITYLYIRVSKHRKLKHRKELIELYTASARPKKYTVFLSYSSLDVDFVMTKVYKQLNEKLQEMLDTEEDCVATGDTHFLPGFQLANQIIKCIEESSVVVIFMTKHFCKSPWCKDEAMTAHYDRKPIILMFGEHVDTCIMPKPLQRHLQVYSRVFWKQENDVWILKPDWTKLCESIISFVDK